MKRSRILLTLLFVALLLLPTALAAVDGDFEYQELDDGTVILTNYKGGEKDLALPEELGGKTVSTLSTDAFSRCSELRSVTIPLSIVEIIEYPFHPWDDSNPFLCCENLEAIHVSPDHPTLAEIDGVLFRKAEKQLLSYPAAKEGASYDVPQGIAAIEDEAFSGNDKLRSVSLPDSVLTVGRNPFYDCRHLLEITVAEGNPALSAVDGVLFRTEDRQLVSYPAGLKKADYAVPDGTVSIGERAFYQCDALESVVLPDSVTEISEEAFNFCTSLKNLKMSDGVTKIGGSAFQHCESLGEATLPDGLEHIGEYAFSYCSSLKSIAIPSSATEIGEAAFAHNARLKSVTLGDGATCVVQYMFYDCSALESVVLPDSVSVIGTRAFYSCRDMTDIALPKGLTTVEYEAFALCSALTDVELPNGLTAIGEGAFNRCGALSSLTIPDSVTEIGEDAFEKCSNLQLTVSRGSCAAQYAEENNIPFTYPDANDWLN